MRHGVFLLLLPALVLLNGCNIDEFGPSDRFQESFHYSFDIRPGGSLSVENVNGPIEIYGADSDTKVEISGAKYGASQEVLQSIRVETHNSADAIEVRTVRPSGFHGNGGARYTIRVPRKILLERIVSSNASLNVRSVEGHARLRTSNGSVHVDDLTGLLEVHTSNAAIDVQRISGSANMSTSNGRISGDDISGDVDAQSSNGSIAIHLREVATGSTKLRTSNASIELTVAKAPRGSVVAESSNGSITLRLPANTSARLTADTSHSNITNEFDIDNRSGDENKSHLDGTIGSGGPTIDLATRNGSIRILKER